MQINPIYEQIIEQLSERDWACVDNFLDNPQRQALLSSLLQRLENAQFKPAGVGNSSQFKLAAEIRRDKICWLDRQDASQAENQFLDTVEDFIQYLNQSCFLGLKSYELHFARYEQGDFYQRHLDQFRQQGSRKLSWIFYLNEHWNETDGGQLRVYSPADDYTDILPLAGRLVVFWSEKVWHEVRPAQKARHSLTGWLKV